MCFSTIQLLLLILLLLLLIVCPFYFNSSFLLLLQLTAEQCKLLLIQAICDILRKCKDDKFRIVTLPDEDTVPSLPTATAATEQEPALNQVPAEASCSTETGTNVCKICLKV